MTKTHVISNFWRWFDSNESRLRSLEITELVDHLHEALADIDESLGIEIAFNTTNGKHEREVVISGSGVEAAMTIAEELVAVAPRCRGWHFIALKPAMGFEFSTDRYGLTIDASVLYFEPMVSRQQPGALGIKVYCPDDVAHSDKIEDAIWHIVETGIGERKAICIAAILTEPDSQRSREALPISELGNCIVRWRSGLN